MKRSVGFLAVLTLSGCDNVCPGPRTIFWGDSWHASEKDSLLDGAKRTSIWTYKDGRSVTVRCFQLNQEAKPFYDLRYEIESPLLEPVATSLQSSKSLTVTLAIDGQVANIYKGRAGYQNETFYLLFDLDKAAILKLASAKKSVNALPRNDQKKLDIVIDFGVENLSKIIEPVLQACGDGPKENDSPSKS